MSKIVAGITTGSGSLTGSPSRSTSSTSGSGSPGTPRSSTTAWRGRP